MDKPLFEIETDQREHPKIENVSGYNGGDYGPGYIYLIPDSNLPDNIREDSKEVISDSLEFLNDFEGSGFIVYEFRTEEGYLTEEFEAEFNWKEEVKSEVGEIYSASRQITGVKPLVEWYFDNQTASLSVYQNSQEPIFIDPKIHGVEALMYEGDSEITILNYDKIIEIWGDEPEEEKEFVGAKLADKYYNNKNLNSVSKSEDMEFEISEFPNKEANLLDELRRELERRGLETEKTEKHPPVIIS